MFTPDTELSRELLERSKNAESYEIDAAISGKRTSLEDFALLLSPNISSDQLKRLANRSYELTRKRFGFALSLYAPLYYDNRCTNGCVYCGFNAKNKCKRVKLTPEEIRKEASVLRDEKFKNILLVAGEHPESSDPEYLAPIMKDLHEEGFSCVSIEIAPLDTEYYATLVKEGHLDGLYVYQETYNRELYKTLHPFGKKADFDYRLHTPERGAMAGVSKIGLGFLLGLHDWREDALALAQHILYLQKHHWQSEYSISFPRIRNAEGVQLDYDIVGDKDFINLVCALRLLFPEIAMSLSTREMPSFRDKILPLGFTSLSAGSSTAPGGYSVKKDEDLEQFQVSDERTPDEISHILSKKGFDPVWKDWE